MRYPMPRRDFIELPDDAVVTVKEFVSTRKARGFINLSRAKWFRLIADGVAPKGSLKTRGAARVWNVAEIKRFAEIGEG